jgi:DNA damage-inducible protein 1
MLLTLQYGDKISAIQVPDDGDMDLLRQLTAAELQLPVGQIEFGKDGAPLGGSATTRLIELLKENDLLVVTRKVTRISINDVNTTKPEELLALVREHPHLQIQYNNADPEFGRVVASGDVKKLRRIMMERYMRQSKVTFEKNEENRRIAANPDGEEAQNALAERIRLENIQANMEMAMEEFPESFGRVVMLYVDLEINGNRIKAFVDSGAQSTIMSVACAERCGLMRLVDTRYAGEARGVGTAKILGRVHIAQMKIGETFFPISLTVLEKNDVDFLLGLDMLKRYRCQIDLSENCLRMDSGRASVSFLSEADMPALARGTLQSDLVDDNNTMDTGTSNEKSKTDIPPTPPPSSTTEDFSGLTTSTAAPSTGASNNETPPTGDDALEHLCGLGFTRQQAAAALQQTNGNVEMAAALLFAAHD